MNTNTTLAEILRGLRLGRVQTVGLMQVIPLLSETPNDSFALPSTILSKTESYGSLTLKNPSKDIAIVPMGSAFITSKKAQDHALPSLGLIPGDTERLWINAGCIQSGQPGTFQYGDAQILILPHPLREYALSVRKQADFKKLWNALGTFVGSMGVQTRGADLSVFLDSYGKQLDLFVAEFEPVDRQVGAVFIIDGKIAGIERAPSYEYWLDVWSHLVRECYGSLALMIAREIYAEYPVNPTSSRVRLSSDVGSLAELLTAVRDAEERENAAAREVLHGLARETFTVENESDLSMFQNLTVQTITSRQFVGQVVFDGAEVVYASVNATGARMKSPAAAVAPLEI